MISINTQERTFFTIPRKYTYFALENNLKIKSIYVINSVLILIKNH